MNFPKVSGYNLLREKKLLPRDFDGELNLVFVPFYQWHQMVVDTWGSFANELAGMIPGFEFYELPTIREMNPLSRSFINEGMRLGIPNQSTRRRTITLYLDKKSFRKALEIPNEQDVFVILVDRDGKILWRAQGEFTIEKGEDLVRLIKEIVVSQGV